MLVQFMVLLRGALTLRVRPERPALLWFCVAGEAVQGRRLGGGEARLLPEHDPPYTAMAWHRMYIFLYCAIQGSRPGDEVRSLMAACIASSPGKSLTDQRSNGMPAEVIARSLRKSA